MRIRQMRYFTAAAAAGSFSGAAAALHIAQPAISNQIAALERSLGVQLFVRHSRGVELTPAGASLLTHAEQILADIEDARKETTAWHGGKQHHIRLGVPTTVIPIAAQPIMREVRGLLPDVALHVVEGMTGHLEKWLESEEIDLAILFAPPSNNRLLVGLLGHEEVVLVGPLTDRLPKKGLVGFSDLAKLPLIHTTRAHQLRRRIDQLATRCNSSLDFVVEIDSLPQIKAMVCDGKGYTILPKVALTTGTKMEHVSHWEFRREDQSRMSLMVAASPSFRRLAFSPRLFSIIQDVVANLVNTGQWVGVSHPPVAGSELRDPPMLAG